MWITVSQIRARISTNEEDSTISNIIEETQKEIEETIGTVSITNTTHIQACINLSCKNLLIYMKTNGELAETNKIGPSYQINKIDKDIDRFDLEYKKFLKKLSIAKLGSDSAVYAVIPANFRDSDN